MADQSPFFRFCWFFVATLLFYGCIKQPEQKTLFQELDSIQTGITFKNLVIQNGENNVLNYTYYFNGGGVAVGDVNNDGLLDIYFSGNQVANHLFINKGNFKFEDVTEKSGVGVTAGWKTGVTMADVNQDGWLDLYVCRSAFADSTLRENLLFINNKDLTFTERSKEFGVNDNSYSSHAVFFDYDKDGDPDLFVLNHSLPQYAGLRNVVVNRKQKGSKFGSKLYRNDKGIFKDVSVSAGIINNVLSFGLGIAVADLNADGWPDMYVSNDFNEEDYFYINNRDGTFRNGVKDATGHISLYSMGSDVADINNDLLPDMVTLDMLPPSNERIKLSSGDDNYDKYQILIDAGFHHQTMRNMLQLNNGDGTFSEIGQLAGISNTDWSWSALLADFDGDGWKDLYISNGYEKDFTNMQFLKFTMDEQVKARSTRVAPDMKMILEKMPSIEEGNFLFRNEGNLTFSNQTLPWGIDRKFKSNGAAYADLDNDGDLDLVVNTMNQPSVLYRNNSVEKRKAVFLKIDLTKKNPGYMVNGTLALIYGGGKQQYMEYEPVRGFQSCMVVPMAVGMNGVDKADSVRIIWPDGKTQLFANVPSREVLTPSHENAREVYKRPVIAPPVFEPGSTLDWVQTQPVVNDFKRQFMLPRMYSATGPKMTSADVNGDGRLDFYVCGPRHQSGTLYLQQADGAWKQKKESAFEADKEHQDEDAIFFDADQDGDADLYVVSGGYSFESDDPLLQDRLYVNNGHGEFSKSLGKLPAETFNGSCVKALDVDGDHDLDLFVGSRMVPGQYPMGSPSMFLLNDGQGTFVNSVDKVSPALAIASMINDASVSDVNHDGRPDLIVVGEWTAIRVLINHGGSLVEETGKWLSSTTLGWWNTVISNDFDNDGDQDLVVGNYGMNNQYHVSAQYPATLMYKDFNNDGQVDPFFCYYIQGKSYPYASRDEALGQVSFLKPRFPDYLSYANATMDQIFTATELKDVKTLQADILQSVYLENKGDHFEIHLLPVQAQFSPVYSIVAFDVDHDGDHDLLLAGNETLVRARIGKSDANRGLVLLNDGKGHFQSLSQRQSGLNLGGDIRQLLFVPVKDHVELVVGELGKPIRTYILPGPVSKSLTP